MTKNPYHYHYPMADMRVDVYNDGDEFVVLVTTISSDYPIAEASAPHLDGAQRLAELYAQAIVGGVIPHPDE